MEQDCQFIVEHRLTDDLLRELLAVFNRRKWKHFLLTWAVFVAIGVFNLCVYDDDFLLILSLSFGPAYVVYLKILPRFQLKQLHRRVKDLRGVTEERVRLCFGERITGSSDDDVSNIDYSRVTKIYDRRLSIILMIGRHQGIIVSKDGFVKGTVDGFRTFIVERCPQVKGISQGGGKYTAWF